MLSRVADSLFWMSRYVERAENVARFIDVNHHFTLDLSQMPIDQWSPLISTTGDMEAFKKRGGGVNRESVLRFLTTDTDNPNGIVSCIQYARENARTAREVISSEMWEIVNRLYLAVRQFARNDDPASALLMCDEVKRGSYLLAGATDATMSHGEAWHFARMGRLLERADKTSRILDVKYFILLPTVQDVGSPLDVVQWSALLKSTSALEMYRRSFGRIVPARVIEFLVLDRQFPRSVRHCVVKAEESMHAITGTPFGSFGNRSEQEMGRLRSDLDFTHINDIIQRGLHEFIDRFQIHLNQVDETIYDSFFALTAGLPTFKLEPAAAPLV